MNSLQLVNILFVKLMVCRLIGAQSFSKQMPILSQFGVFWYSKICVGLLSICFFWFIIGMSSGLSVCCQLRFQCCANDRFSVDTMLVIYRSQIGRFHTESYPKWPPTWTRLVSQCLQQQCRWPTAAWFNENFAIFAGFMSVWPMWLG